MNPGTDNPALTLTYSGLVNGDSPNQLSVQPAVSKTAQKNSPPGKYTIVVSGAASPDYTITYQTSTLTVKPIVVTNTFTTNGDGVNDAWQLDAFKDYPNCTVAVFNTSGSTVVYSANYPVNWHGRFNGNELPVGTYYYIIDLKNGSKPLSGAISISANDYCGRMTPGNLGDDTNGKRIPG